MPHALGNRNETEVLMRRVEWVCERYSDVLEATDRDRIRAVRDWAENTSKGDAVARNLLRDFGQPILMRVEENLLEAISDYHSWQEEHYAINPLAETHASRLADVQLELQEVREFLTRVLLSAGEPGITVH